MLGTDEGYNPKHSKAFTNLNDIIRDALKRYIKKENTGKFPTDRHSFD